MSEVKTRHFGKFENTIGDTYDLIAEISLFIGKHLVVLTVRFMIFKTKDR